MGLRAKGYQVNEALWGNCERNYLVHVNDHATVAGFEISTKNFTTSIDS